ncbi:MAG: hypothetical protein JWM43_590 [Acidobacteriaceae bacterium]|nr:hypothetical protein [Acidobacteriaceae bacterium]
MEWNRKAMFGQYGRVVLLALCTTVLAAIPMLAQDNVPPPQDGPGTGQDMGGRMGRGNPEKMEERQLQMMTKQLNLTPEQVTQVKGIYADSDTQMKALRDDTSTAQADKRGKMRSIMEDRQAKVRAVLTDDQKTKLDAMQAKMRERRQERQDGGGDALSPPPQ